MLLTVLTALSDVGAPAALKDKLHAIALDQTRPYWQRARAATAWIAGAEDPLGARRAIYDEIAALPLNRTHVNLRAGLADGLPRDRFGPEDLRALLLDFDGLSTRGGDEDDDDIDGSAGALTWLIYDLGRRPCPGLLDQPFGPEPVGDEWRPRFKNRTTAHLIDQAIASSIRSTPDLSAIVYGDGSRAYWEADGIVQIATS